MNETKIKYSKPIMTRKEFIKESGYAPAFVDRAIHSRWKDAFTIRSSDAPNAKVMIITDEFEYYRRHGALI